MSSPSSLRGHETPQPMPPSIGFDEDEDAADDIPRRLMRVKVLYTFDDQNQSNCLARLPSALNIPTVSLDENTQVGVIELKTCIQAIVTASPELVAKLGHDYTVYAYDFSEYENPLVGQGMLSWILASTSSTPNAPANQSNTMVTGRVCKNLLGLFSNGIKETLEVKLKLVPVPTCLQSEYVENMEKYRSLSKILPEGFDYNSWVEFLKANPGIGKLAGQGATSPPQPDQRINMGGVESIHQMLTRTISPSDDGRCNGYSYRDEESYSALGSRAGSPTPSMQSCSALQQITQEAGSRPVSRASIRSERPPLSRQQSYHSEIQQEQTDDGPAKKRARITKVSRPGRSSFGIASDSLRVTASTAASVRLHRPIPSYPSSIANSIEPPPRAPTPRPGESNPTHLRHGRPTLPSALRRGSLGNQHTRYVSPYAGNSPYSDAVDSADEDQGGSSGETPMEFPSSPPLLPQGHNSPAPSSPGLPTLPYPADSGFVSDNIIDREDEVGRTRHDSEVSHQARLVGHNRNDRTFSHHPWQEDTFGPAEPLPKPFPTNRNNSLTGDSETSASTNRGSAPTPPTMEHSHVPNPSSMEDQLVTALIQSASAENPPSPQLLGPVNPQGHPRSESCVQFENHSKFQNSSRSENVVQPENPAPPSRKRSRPTKGRTLPRSQTWSGSQTLSDVPTPFPGEECGTALPRSGTGRSRKKNIQEKAASAIAAGLMPQFCSNCGEIETSTWRKAYARTENGSPEDHSLASAAKEGIVGFEMLDAGEGEDTQSKYRIFKQSISVDEQDLKGFEVLMLCNPCGLWFNKRGSMRPQEIWTKQAVDPANKPKRKRNRPNRGNQDKKSQDQDAIMSDAIQEPFSTGFTDSITPSDGVQALPSQPPAKTIDVPGSIIPTSLDGTMENNGPADESGASNQMDAAVAEAALLRAIQSSPVRFHGTKHSPIDLESDLTPSPTRRVLFPSPRKEGEIRTLNDCPDTTSPTPRDVTSNPTEESVAPGLELDNAEDFDKENCPPLPDEHDDLAHLFEEMDHEIHGTPKNGHLFSDLLKTPTPKSGRQSGTPRRSQNNTAILTTPSRGARVGALAPLTPFTAQLNAIMSGGIAGSSPLQLQSVDYSDLGIFDTPGRSSSAIQFTDWTNDDFLSSDLPMPSSPPGGLFSLYEDPATSTHGLWDGTSIFGSSDSTQQDTDQGQGVGSKGQDRLDLSAMIEEVAGTGKKSEDEQATNNAQAITDA
ncbi:uncharacterized protein BDZ99DRAFT_405234 [Mytilinidion resinicola]|uniref:Ams2/SPT21 N-terminal domain-containing protein n=1 Tax=Mytilinidion resinicola TaxID=574789 RepID=A0A6A6ZA17_9PEZI|nr:uncharacterized protein BDZ99DRAFT_405234 [Mytilinidion resinicola]KAF2817539.1 hypothetical protein BDZ99DRAFT_405234 [Mytilinidion resinicola]